MPRILLTGGNGFLGTALLKNPLFKDALVVGRTSIDDQSVKFAHITLDASSDYTPLLTAIDVVVHAAARVHVMDETSVNPLREYREINTHATLNLARQASVNGVKRFIFISSIKVLGEQTKLGEPFTSDSPLEPKDPYAISKAEAEIGLHELARNSSMEIVIIRPPLVYGKGVKGNFAKLLRLTAWRIPLPFGSIKNRRSLVSIENLVDLICVCLEHKKAKNGTFLVSDDNNMSTPELLAHISESLGLKSRLFKFSSILLMTAFKVLGKHSSYQKLCCSMEADISHTKSQLSWVPPFTTEDCLKNCWPD